MFLFGAEAVWSQMTEFTYQAAWRQAAHLQTEIMILNSFCMTPRAEEPSWINNRTQQRRCRQRRVLSKTELGNQFTGANRFLEIRLRPSGQSGMTILSPRQLINSAPYAVKI
jgi:hypothetical protein